MDALASGDEPPRGGARRLVHALAAFYLLLIAAASWNARRDESLVLGIGAVFAVGLLTCYYWAMLLVAPLGNRTG